MTWTFRVLNASGQCIQTHEIPECDIATYIAMYQEQVDQQGKPVEIEVTQSFTWKLTPSVKQNGKPVHTEPPHLLNPVILDENCLLDGGG